jgi:hypothetical protein
MRLNLHTHSKSAMRLNLRTHSKSATGLNLRTHSKSATGLNPRMRLMRLIPRMHHKRLTHRTLLSRLKRLKWGNVIICRFRRRPPLNRPPLNRPPLSRHVQRLKRNPVFSIL